MKKKFLKKDNVVVGLDASSSKCGVALYINGSLHDTFLIKKKGNFSKEKLHQWIIEYGNIFSKYCPDLVVLEEPITARMLGTKSISTLNQVAGAIIATALFGGIELHLIHNKTAKALLGVNSKEEANDAMRKMYPTMLGSATEDELDAVLMVEALRQQMKLTDR